MVWVSDKVFAQHVALGSVPSTLAGEMEKRPNLVSFLVLCTGFVYGSE